MEFRVGQRVKTKRISGNPSLSHLVGTITRVVDDGDSPYPVYVEVGSSQISYGFLNSELTLTQCHYGII